jgi:hypothetical protein
MQTETRKGRVKGRGKRRKERFFPLKKLLIPS